MVQKTHKHRLTRRIFPCLFYLLKYKYQLTARYSTLDENYAFASLAMFVIQYLIKECSIIVPFVPTYKTCIETRHENRDRFGSSGKGWAD